MASTLYVNKFGGVIVHKADGSSEHLLYGQPVPDDLADHVDPKTFADSGERRGHASDDPIRAAHNRAAQTDYSPGSSTSPVPSNYESLTEDEAALFVQSLGDPKAQAALVVHERLNGGARQAVLDAASNVAQAFAEQIIGADAVQPRTPGEGAPVPADPDPQGPNAFAVSVPDVDIPAPTGKEDDAKDGEGADKKAAKK